MTFCGYDSQRCATPDLCADAEGCALSVACQRCGRPSGIYPATLRANGATSVTCAACARETAPVDP